MTAPPLARCRIVVFAKAPLAGYAKTRLIPALGAQGAADLARRMLNHAVTQALGAGRGEVELCCAPDSRHAAFASWAQRPGLRLTDQGEGDLGVRMARAIERGLTQSAKVLLMGSDAPALDSSVLRNAADALNTHDAVFVPALDGGYVLVGLRRPARHIFEGMLWSTPRVMQQTRERLAELGLRHAELAPLPDIDEAADLLHVPRDWL
ncbi:MAG: TIGR04282 family arsenosugar biosynthesis glycosyltransferase [Burkholderiaceae bacterium]